MRLPPFVSAIASAMSGRLATAAVNYGLFWYMARTVDGHSLGGFSLLMSLFLMVSLLPMLGVSTPFMRRVSVSRGALETEVSNAAVFAIPNGLVLALAVGCWGHFAGHHELEPAYWLVAATLVPGAWTMVAECTLLAQERIRDVTRVNLLEVVVRTLASVLALHQGLGLTGVFAAFFVARCLSGLVYAMHPCVPLPRLAQCSAALQRRNWEEVPVFLGITVVAALVARVDVVMVSHIRGLADAATYSAASRLYEAAQMLPTVTALLVMPMLARRHVDAPETIPAALALTVRLGLGIGLGLAVFASAFARPLVALLYRPDMAGAAAPLACLAFAAAIMLVDVVLSSAMIATSAQRDDLRSLAVGLAALVLGLLVLVPAHGAFGAAISVTLGVISRVAMRLRWAVRVLHLPPPWWKLVQLAAACAAGAAAVAALQGQGPIVAGLLGLLSYLAAAILAGALNRQFLQDLRSGVTFFNQRG